MTATRTRRASLAVALAGVLALSACSHDDEPAATDLVAQAQSEQYAQEQADQARVKQANAALPDPTTGEIEIDGSSSIELTSDEIDRFRASGTNTIVNVSRNGEETGFQRLCSGKVDLVSSLRSISRDEWEACQAVGLDVAQFQLASDAIVVAIKSESDVGGDCLSTDQVQEIWRAGSPVTNWGQVELDDLPLKVGGPALDTPEFSVFSKSVLGTLAPATTDVRSDYSTYDDFDEALAFLNGGSTNIDRATQYADLARARGLRKSELDTERQVYADARDELQVALDERAKGIRDQRSVADKAKDQARVDAAYASVARARSKVVAAKARYEKALDRLRVATDAKRAVDGTRGHVTYARFSDYEVYEDQMRPFEITLADGQRNCVFPSQQTITDGSYPFASQVLLTTTTRSLDRSEVRDFVTHYLKASTDAANEAHLIPVPDATLAAQLEWLDGDHEPALVSPSPTTSDSADAEASDGATPAAGEPAR